MATKKIIEKKTGEKYASKKAMVKHEKSESKTEQKKEYGKVKRTPAKMVKEKSPLRQAKSTIDSAMREKKNSPTKMKKC